MAIEKTSEPAWLERVTYPVPEGDEHPWQLSIDWCTDRNGRVVPARLELSSVWGFDWSDPENGDFADHPVGAITAGFMRRTVPWDDLIERSRRAVLDSHRGHDAECCEIEAAELRPPDDDFDALIHRVAMTYRMVVHTGSRQPAFDTWKLLSDQKVKGVCGNKALTRERVRALLQKARDPRRGYLPPVDRKEGTE